MGRWPFITQERWGWISRLRDFLPPGDSFLLLQIVLINLLFSTRSGTSTHIYAGTSSMRSEKKKRYEDRQCNRNDQSFCSQDPQRCEYVINERTSQVLDACVGFLLFLRFVLLDLLQFILLRHPKSSRHSPCRELKKKRRKERSSTMKRWACGI